MKKLQQALQEKDGKSEGKLLSGLDIKITEDSDLESKMISQSFSFKIKSECLSLWFSDAENYTQDMDEGYTFSEKLEGTSMSDDVIKRSKNEA